MKTFKSKPELLRWVKNTKPCGPFSVLLFRRRQRTSLYPFLSRTHQGSCWLLRRWNYAIVPAELWEGAMVALSRGSPAQPLP